MQYRGESSSATDRSNGGQAIAGALIAILGVLAAGNPESTLLRALSEAAPQLGTAIPMVISAVGAIIAALSQPPKIGRK